MIEEIRLPNSNAKARFFPPRVPYAWDDSNGFVAFLFCGKKPIEGRITERYVCRINGGLELLQDPSAKLDACVFSGANNEADLGIAYCSQRCQVHRGPSCNVGSIVIRKPDGLELRAPLLAETKANQTDQNFAYTAELLRNTFRGIPQTRGATIVAPVEDLFAQRIWDLVKIIPSVSSIGDALRAGFHVDIVSLEYTIEDHRLRDAEIYELCERLHPLRALLKQLREGKPDVQVGHVLQACRNCTDVPDQLRKLALDTTANDVTCLLNQIAATAQPTSEDIAQWHERVKEYNDSAARL